MSKREILTQKKWKTLEAPCQTIFHKRFSTYVQLIFFIGLRASSHEPGRTGCMARFTPGPFSPWVHMRNFSPVSEMTLKRPKILGTSYGANFEKQRKHRETQKLSRIRVFHSYANSYSCITAVKWDAYCVENTACNGKMPSRPAEFIPLSSR